MTGCPSQGSLFLYTYFSAVECIQEIFEMHVAIYLAVNPAYSTKHFYPVENWNLFIVLRTEFDKSGNN